MRYYEVNEVHYSSEKAVMWYNYSIIHEFLSNWELIGPSRKQSCIKMEQVKFVIVVKSGQRAVTWYYCSLAFVKWRAQRTKWLCEQILRVWQRKSCNQSLVVSSFTAMDAYVMVSINCWTGNLWHAIIATIQIRILKA
jgi:hypothetical protein